MAESKIDLSSSAIQTVAEASHVQFVPCNVNHVGSINLSSYFTPYVQKQTSSDGKELLSATFRGFPFTGEESKVPEGFTGFVLRETKSFSGEAGEMKAGDCDEDSANQESTKKTLKGVCKFDKFTYWNWDREPSQADKYKQALNWLEIADVIHGVE